MIPKIILIPEKSNDNHATCFNLTNLIMQRSEISLTVHGRRRVLITDKLLAIYDIKMNEDKDTICDCEIISLCGLWQCQ